MKRLATLTLALTFAFGAVAVTFAQDTKKEDTSKKSKKKNTKKKSETPKKDGGAL